MRLLLISNSTNPGEPYLDYPKHEIRKFLGNKPVKVLFVPYAAVTFSWNEYEAKVAAKYNEIGHEIVSIHNCSDPIMAVMDAEAIAVGGGNTWQLLDELYRNGLIGPIREKVLAGTPYMGWSAGSNVACPTIMTTNDMPIVEPPSFRALNLLPFQINPHYLDANPAGHAGETREQRILEFIEANPSTTVVGLREGTMLLVNGKNMSLIGPRPSRIFKKGDVATELAAKDDFSFLLV